HRRRRDPDIHLPRAASLRRGGDRSGPGAAKLVGPHRFPSHRRRARESPDSPQRQSKEETMKRTFVIALILAAAAPIASAAGPGPRGPRHGPGGGGMWGGPLWEASLFRPDFVLQNQSQIGLTDDQILAITKDVGATHDKLRAQHDTVKGLADQ